MKHFIFIFVIFSICFGTSEYTKYDPDSSIKFTNSSCIFVPMLYDCTMKLRYKYAQSFEDRNESIIAEVILQEEDMIAKGFGEYVKFVNEKQIFYDVSVFAKFKDGQNVEVVITFYDKKIRTEKSYFRKI